LKQLKFKNKKAAAFGCYGWSGESVKVLKEKLADAGFDVIEQNVRSQWNPEEADFAQIPELVAELLK
jgi:anaerobic nitric oxide reductase flavorubredoxin